MSTIEELNEEVAELTTATTDLLAEVIDQKDRLTEAADTATTKASDANQSAIDSESEANRAKTEADKAQASAVAAETSKNQAAEITGLDTVEEAVELALSESNSMVMTASQHDAILAQNEAKYAASGTVHYGNRYGSDSYAVNEGMYAEGTTPGVVKIGTESAPTGTSKTNFMVTHIAGVVASVNKVNATPPSEVAILLPPAPNGTIIYDSTGDARGTGNANLNLRTEIDPKYGDIASTDNEAVARAFEGMAKNGDIRDGANQWAGASITAANGRLTIPSAGTSNSQAYSAYIAVEQNTEYVVEFYNYAITTGYLTSTAYISTTTTAGGALANTPGKLGLNRFTFNSSSNTDVRFLNYAIGGSGAGEVVFGGVRVYKATEEVVTDRVDMFGLEQFDMVIKDDEVFDMVQSQSTTFGDTDVPTVDSIRPDSFFAVYDGQTGIVKGKCVKWSTLTDTQKRKVAEYMKERLWINEDGDLTFTTIRQRTIAGAGNGDWSNVDSNTATSNWLQPTPNLLIKPQGKKDVAAQPSAQFPTYGTQLTAQTSKVDTHKGVFQALSGTNVPDENVAYKGRCFFYVLGTVSRLNQGAYAPNLNESGTAYLNAATFSDTWYNGNGRGVFVPTTKAQCFNALNTDANNTDVGYNMNTGAIGGDSGRSDGRLYDAIYAGGEGGVVDYRLSAYDMSSPEESAKAWEKVKNGTYRGLEKLVWTRVTTSTQTAHAGTNGIEVSEGTSRFSLGDKVSLQRESSGVLEIIEGKVIEINPTFIRTDAPDYVRYSEEYRIIHTSELSTSVSGNFTMTDAIGDPANILLTDALKDGWQGSWIPQVPPVTGTNAIKLTRKCIQNGNIPIQYTLNNGIDWTATSILYNSTTNTSGTITNANEVRIYNYTAFAKQTKPSTNKPVLNGEAGVGSVFNYMRSQVSRGALLHESLIGKIPVSDGAGTYGGTLNLTQSYVDTDNGGVFGTYVATKHAPLSLTTPSNNSPAVKALPYQISDNGQCSIGIQANELTYDTSPAIEIDGTTPLSYTANQRYSVDTGSGKVLVTCVVDAASSTFTAFRRNASGEYVNGSDGVVWVESGGASGGWGDDSTMKITTDGSDTFVDLNNNTNLSVAHELALPIGWAHNHARISTQIAGIDL